ncbi:MAG TPA: response regulator transcription factor [Brumimicrobium sp.]|nr:response regulator transcription factor [Brumimicrobium sp.]
MKVIIADSNEIVLVGLRTILASDPIIEVVGEAISSEQLLEQLRTQEVDVVLLDYTAPGYTIDVIPKALNIHKKLKIVAITPEQSPSVIMDALKSGVTSYIKKDCDIAEILASVRETICGNKFFCGQILDSIRRASIDVEHLDLENFSCEPVLLSERELEIIKFIAEGNTNAQIADILCLSPHTITTHRKNIMAKLGTKNTAGIVMYAVKSNLVSPNKFLFARDS